MKTQTEPLAAGERTRIAGGYWIRVPACLGILICLILGFSILRPNSSGLLAHYQALAQKSLDSHDYATAAVASLRLMSFGEQYRNEALFKLAQAKIGLGQRADAANLLEMVGYRASSLEGTTPDVRRTSDPMQQGQVKDDGGINSTRATGGGKAGGFSDRNGMDGNAPLRAEGSPDPGRRRPRRQASPARRKDLQKIRAV